MMRRTGVMIKNVIIMKRTVLFICGMALLAAGCVKEINQPEVETPQHLIINITVNHDSPETRAVKQGWEMGDKIYVFFDINESTSSAEYMTMTYDGSAWSHEFSNDTMEAGLLENTNGKLYAVYFPYGTPTFSFYAASSGPKINISFEQDVRTYFRTNYSSSFGSDYTIDAAGKLTAVLNMSVGSTYVQFFVPGITDAENYLFRCNQMKASCPDYIQYYNNKCTLQATTNESRLVKGYPYGDGVIFTGILYSTANGKKVDYSFSITDNKGTEDTSDDTVYSLSFEGDKGKTLNYHDAVKLPALNSGKWKGSSNGQDFVNLGDGQLWATKNVGATSESDAGGYFAWGETASKTSYGWDNYAWGHGETSLTKYNLNSSTGTVVDNLTVLESEDDAATANWGEGWRTPTASEWLWLYSNCDRSIEQVDGVTGFRYTSRIAGYTSNSIFIPATKYYDGSTLVEGEGQVSYYWSSSLNGENSIYAQSNGISQTHDILNGPTPQYRYLGLPVRAVCTLPTSVTGIELSQSSLNMELGDSPYTLGATILPDNATNQTITWSSSDESVASIVPNGNVCSIGAAGVGTATITATTADGGHSATCTVTVTGVPVTGVTLDKTELTLSPGETYKLTATVSPDDASVKTVKWTSSNPEDVWVENDGTVKALAENGSSIITVTTDNGGYTATCEVTVKYVPVTSVILNKTTLSLSAGASETLTATWSPEDATNPVMIWSTSDESIVTVDYEGKVTADEDCRGGNATITVSMEAGKVTATCEVTVTVPVTEVVLSHETWSMAVGDSYTLGASVRPIYATNQNISWSSSNTGIVTVDSNGTIKGISVGTATITATSEDGGYTDTCEVTVTAPPTSGEINGHSWVAMGVKSADGKVLKWATYNVGASKPEENGNYYAWGEISTKNKYSWDTYFYGTENNLTKYVTDASYGTVDNKTVLEDVDDVARWSDEWGNPWRMPTDAEWSRLRNETNFTWEWTTNYNGTGVAGRIVTSKMEGYKGNQIFLPVAGYRDGTFLNGAGTHGYYWSSSLHTGFSFYAFNVYFSSSYVGRYGYGYRYYGYTVRAVSE
jgi:uncharacterized protein YjdB